MSKEQLEALESLKKKGFKFRGWGFREDKSGIWIKGDCVPDTVDELDLIFGGRYGVD